MKIRNRTREKGPDHERNQRKRKEEVKPDNVPILIKPSDEEDLKNSHPGRPQNPRNPKTPDEPRRRGRSVTVKPAIDGIGIEEPNPKGRPNKIKAIEDKPEAEVKFPVEDPEQKKREKGQDRERNQRQQKRNLLSQPLQYHLNQFHHLSLKKQSHRNLNN